MYQKRTIMIRSWADCISGRNVKAVDTIKKQIDLLLDSREEVEVTYHLGVLADLQIRQERYSEALTTIDKALELARKNREKFYIAEPYRLKARALTLGPEVRLPGDDSNYLLMAEKTAKSQRAKAWLDRLARSSEETVN